MKNRISYLMLMILFAGCDSSEFNQAGFLAESTQSGILLINRTGVPVYLFVAGEKEMSRIRWAPTIGTDNVLYDNQSIEIDRLKFDPGKEESRVLVYWWRAEVRENEVVPGEVHQIILTVQ